MQDLNWNLFRTKFNGKETKAFEYLCLDAAALRERFSLKDEG